jgi:putative DNA primase/helicase
MVERTEAALIRGGAEIYQSGDWLVRPVIREELASKGRKTSIVGLHRVDHAWLKAAIAGKVNFLKWNKGEEKLEPTGPSGDVVNTVLSRYGDWTFPRITGIVSGCS